MTLFTRIASICSLALATHAGAATVTSCDRQLQIETPPQRAVSHDVNLTAMMLGLGLQSRMIGYTGVSGWKTLTPALDAELAQLPELAPRYPSLEVLLEAQADFFFAGWNYGMQVGGEVTPTTLSELGIDVYELSESCAHVMPRRAARLDDLYTDLRNLGAIFAVEDRAEALVAQVQARVDGVAQRLHDQGPRPRVFLYDSGEDRAFSAGRLAMPQALIEAAGGSNVMADVEASWSQVNWESVVERDPEVIVIVDYGPRSAEQKRDYLLSHPALQTVAAIRNQRFVVLPYLSVTPSLDNGVAVETLAHAFYPQVFTEPQP